MNMVRYGEIAKREEDKEPLVVKFDSIENPVLISDFYCINPLCNCTSLLLYFLEVANGEIVGQLFSLRLDIKTWEITDVSIKTKSAGYKKIIDEFKKGLDISIKNMLLNHFKEAKEFGRQNPLKAIDPSVIADGYCVPYTDIFGEGDSLFFEYEGVNYLIDDHYCMDPNCSCNEVLLAFIDILPNREVQQAKFIIRLKLDDLSYEIEKRKVSRKELNEIVQYFINNKRDKVIEFKVRYKKMNKLGKELLDKYKKSKTDSMRPDVKVGRNAPCPCGSGKKYKNCCGR